MSGYRSLLDYSRAWYPNMPRPDGWGDLLISVWQERIDAIVGTTDDKPRIKLQWGPEALKWRPARVGEGAYDFPLLWAGFQGGKAIAAPRWVLLERDEPESYAPSWELHRRLIVDGIQYDIRGPCPKERYTLCWVQQVHEDGCCLETPADEACWGRYAEPNEEMLDWVRAQWQATLADPDVQPFTDARIFHAPEAQREERNRVQRIEEQQRSEREREVDEADTFWQRNPHTITGKVNHAS